MFQNIIKAYGEIDEKNRLQSTLARKVEFISTVETLNPYIHSNIKILDIGCGAGIYSIYYAKKGAKVTAIDLVPNHIKQLNKQAKKLDLHICSYTGNAIDLSYIENETFDLVLCLGPLYHLLSQQHRKKCIEECIRVSKPNGIIAFSYISPYSVFPCVIRGDKSRMSKELIKKIIIDKKISSNDKSCFWTDTFFYTPQDIEKLLKKENLIIIDHLASDGQSIAFQSLINTMTEKEFNIWLDYHRKTCREPSIIGASNHGLIITRKKG